MSEVIKIDDQFSIDLAYLKHSIMNDYDEVVSGMDMHFYLETAENFNVSTNDLNDIEVIYDMSDLDNAFNGLSAVDMLNLIDQGIVNVSLKDKYVAETNDGRYFSTNKDFTAILRSMGEKISDEIIKRLKADISNFDEIYDLYKLSGVDNALERN